MAKTLDALPHELLLHTAFHLSRQDLVQLNIVCKRLNVFAERLLWTDIEFHSIGYHEASDQLREPPPFQPPSRRLYLAAQNSRAYGARDKVAELCRMFYHLQTRDLDRLKRLATRVRSLCTVAENVRLDPMVPSSPGPGNAVSILHFVPYFTNLEVLEVHSDGLDFGDIEEQAPGMGRLYLPKLRFAKLSGQIPRAFAAWVLRSGPTLERLELALLDIPIGCIIPDLESASLSGEDVQDEEGSASDGDSNDATPGSEFAALWHQSAVIPRPLGGFLPTSNGEGTAKLSLPMLKHLHLCRPCEGAVNQRCNAEYVWSYRSDKASLAAWRQLLLASSNTLETLVLDHRVGATYLERGKSGEPISIVDSYNPDGSTSLLRMLNKHLTQKGGLSALKKVYLYGIAVGKSPTAGLSDSVPGGQLMKLLESQGVSCEARVGKWCFFSRYLGETYWAQWEAETDDEGEGSDEDDEDEGSDEDANEPTLTFRSLLASV